MKFKLLVIALSLFSCMAYGQKKKKTKKNKGEIKLETYTDSVSYSLGADIGRILNQRGATNMDMKIFNAAMHVTMKGEESKINKEDGMKLIQSYFEKLHKDKLEKNKKEGEAFLEANKKKEGVKVTESGIQYIILKEGDGLIPVDTNKVKVHYHGTLIDGTVFDSSVDRGEPATFPVTGVIKGWQEILQLMPVGSKWKVFIPTELAYGESVRPGGKIEPNMALVFEIELLEIILEEKKEEK